MGFDVEELAKALASRFPGFTLVSAVSWETCRELPDPQILLDALETRQGGTVPPPGSDAALERGCTCPVYDNAHGAGRGKDEHGQTVYVMDWDCPLHGGKEE